MNANGVAILLMQNIKKVNTKLLMEIVDTKIVDANVYDDIFMLIQKMLMLNVDAKMLITER